MVTAGSYKGTSELIIESEQAQRKKTQEQIEKLIRRRNLRRGHLGP
jgi:hypothetical protein